MMGSLVSSLKLCVGALPQPLLALVARDHGADQILTMRKARENHRSEPIVSAASLGFLALLGAIGARAGGANVLRATARVTFWGALAMALTAGIGKLLGTVV